jgi:hypothetical protein
VSCPARPSRQSCSARPGPVGSPLRRQQHSCHLLASHQTRAEAPLYQGCIEEGTSDELETQSGSRPVECPSTRKKNSSCLPRVILVGCEMPPMLRGRSLCGFASTALPKHNAPQHINIFILLFTKWPIHDIKNSCCYVNPYNRIHVVDERQATFLVNQCALQVSLPFFFIKPFNGCLQVVRAPRQGP